MTARLPRHLPRWFFLPALLFLAATPARGACERPINVAFYDLGVLYNPNTGSGLDRDVIAALFARLDCSYVAEFDSRVRIWARLAGNQLDMSVSAIPTDERQQFAHFVPYFWAQNQLVFLDEAPLPANPEDFLADPALRLGVVKSYRHGPGWDPWIERLRQQGRVEEAADTASLVNLLRARRIAAFPALATVASDLQQRYGLHQKTSRTHWFVDQPKIEHGLVINRQRVPAATIELIKQAMAAMQADGSLLKIYQRHVPEAMARELLQASPAAPLTRALRFSITSAWRMPFANTEREVPSDGIVIHLAEEVGKALKLPVTYVVLPRNRVDDAVAAGSVDVRCYTDPAWAREPARYWWSSPLFELPEVLFGPPGSAAPGSQAAIPDGSSIGAVLGYVYPALEADFKHRRLIREDAVDQEKVVQKVSARRNDYGISNVITLDWLLRRAPKNTVAPWRLTLTASQFRCGVVKNSPLAAKKILAAIEQLKTSGKISQLVDQYR